MNNNEDGDERERMSNPIYDQNQILCHWMEVKSI